MREREVDVVAAEQDVVADRDALDRGLAALLRRQLEQAEVRGAAADIDHEHMMRIRLGAPGLPAVPLQPPVEGGLRLLQQAHAFGVAGLSGGGEREALRGGVERGGHGDGDVLRLKREIRTVLGEALVPSVAEVGEDLRRGRDGGDLVRRAERVRAPGQEGGHAVGGVMGEPGFGGLDDAARRLAAAALRQPANGPFAAREPVLLQLRGDGLLRQIEEGRQRRLLGQGRRRLVLGDVEHLRAALAPKRRIGEHGIAGAEIDADAVPRHP